MSEWERLDEKLEVIRARIHDQANVLGTLAATLAVMQKDVSDTKSIISDHESRVRMTERLLLEHISASGHSDSNKVIDKLENKVEQIESSLDNVRLRMSLWAGGGAVLGSVIAFAVPVLAKAMGG